MEKKEYFPQIGKIKFEGTESKNPLAFRYYDAEKVVMGKKMKDWLKFAMAWWHTLGQASGDQFGGQTRTYAWDEGACPVCRAKAKADAGFEIMQKLGIEYFCFHDVDLIEEADTIEEYEERMQTITDYLQEKMKETGIKLLWGSRTHSTPPSNSAARTMCSGEDVKATAVCSTPRCRGRKTILPIC